MRSRETIAARHAPLRPLLAKELREIVAGRALWILLLLMCPLIGYSFFQAVSLYAESSIAAQQSPVLAASLSPLDGVLVPTFGASYVAVTLLFPFVAIRVLGQEKKSGTLRLLVQLPYRTSVLIAAKLAAILAGVVAVSLPALATLAWWTSLGGHLSMPETSNLVAGHVLYGLLVGTIALFAAAVTEFDRHRGHRGARVHHRIMGPRFHDRGPARHSGLAGPSLADAGPARFRAGPLVGGAYPRRHRGDRRLCDAGGDLAAAGRRRPASSLCRSIVCILATIVVLTLIAQIGFSRDVTEDRRNSFPAADARVLAKLSEPLRVSVHLAPEDPRFIDLQRNVLSKLRARDARRHDPPRRRPAADRNRYW